MRPLYRGILIYKGCKLIRAMYGPMKRAELVPPDPTSSALDYVTKDHRDLLEVMMAM